MIIVDTSVIIAVLQGVCSRQTEVFREAEKLDEDIAIPAVCVQEVLQGAKDEKQWRLLNSYLGSQHIVTAQDPVKTHIAAARLFYIGRRQGITIRSATDCFIAQLVIEHAAALLHCDRDFEQLKQICKLRTVL